MCVCRRLRSRGNQRKMRVTIPADRNVSALTDRDKVRQVLIVTWGGLFVNVALTVLNFAGGVLGASQAVTAHAFHTLSDLSTDVAVLIGVRYWSQPADEDHPHGHKRIETVVTIMIGVALAVVAVGLVQRALTTLSEKHLRTPGLFALTAACLSILGKEILYRWTAAVGRRIRSSAVVANAWHHRSDALSSIPAALAVGGAMIYPAWWFLDHIGAVVVSLLIFQAAWKIGRPALKQLVDAGAPLKERNRIESLVLANPHVRRVHAIRTRYLGPGLEVDLHIHVDPDLTVREGHDISESVKERLLSEGPDVADVVVHLEPDESAGDSSSAG